MSEQWISPAQCIGLSGMPGTLQGVHKMAKREGWNWRKREGVRGNAIEFSLTALPPTAQVQFIKRTGNVIVSGRNYELKNKQEAYCREVLWHHWESATEKQRQAAQKKTEAVHAVSALVDMARRPITRKSACVSMSRKT
ncbi:DNA-binding protein [Serratia marcescens]|uniref:DNA-binding protein n=1 Tax=Serratia marcescens TaxID=615 RepID=UPI003D164500